VYKAFSREGQAYYSIWFTDKTMGEETYGSGKIFFIVKSLFTQFNNELNFNNLH
jgi:hypothetical protein